MNKLSLVAACAATAIVGLTGCADDDDPEPRRDHVWTAELEGIGAFGDLAGTSEVRWGEGAASFTATIELVNDEPGAVRPWHVHFGTCGSGGGIVGDDADYPRLEIGEDGTDRVTVSVARSLTLGEAYHVNVHLSDDDLATLIACGDLARVGDGGGAPGGADGGVGY